MHLAFIFEKLFAERNSDIHSSLSASWFLSLLQYANFNELSHSIGNSLLRACLQETAMSFFGEALS